MRTAIYDQENLHFVFGMEKPGLKKFHVFDVAIEPKKIG